MTSLLLVMVLCRLVVISSQLTPTDDGLANSPAGLVMLIFIALSGRERSLESELHLFI